MRSPWKKEEIRLDVYKILFIATLKITMPIRRLAKLYFMPSPRGPFHKS